MFWRFVSLIFLNGSFIATFAVAAGCVHETQQTQHTPPRNMSPLHDLLTQARADSISPIVGREYKRYLAEVRNGIRGDAFIATVLRLDRVPPISGLEWVGLFGAPDDYVVSGAGRIGLRYYFFSKERGKRCECSVTLDASGTASEIAYGVLE